MAAKIRTSQEIGCISDKENRRLRKAEVLLNPKLLEV